MGKVVHFEIPADDVERAQQFYQGVFGWHLVSMPDMGYTMVHTGPTDDQTGMAREHGFINGGMLKREEPVTRPVITISVSSIAETAQQIQARGGRMIRGRFAVGDMGFAAYFADSEGNVLGLWENKS